MMKNKKIWLGVFLIVIAIMLYGFARLLEEQTKAWMYELEIEDLTGQADTVAGFLSELDSGNSTEVLNPYISKGGSTSNFRITIFNESGKVLADSWLPMGEQAKLGNDLERPEVTSANLHTAGVSVRNSRAIGQKLMYVAKRYHGDGFSGIVRIATPLAIITRDLKELHVELLEAIVVLFLIFSGITAYAYKYMRRADQSSEAQQKTLALLNKKLKDDNLIRNFGRALRTCESTEELESVVSQLGGGLFGELTIGALAISPPSLDIIDIVATWGADWPGEKRYSPKECWGFRRGSAQLSKKGSMEMQCQHVDTNHYAIQCTPLQSHGVSLGALHVGASAEVLEDAAFRNKVKRVSEQLCLTISNLNLRKKLEQQAIRDPLTYLYNRRYLDDSFMRELKRAERKKMSLAVIMIDIDHFKVFNDTFGHDAGDYVIQEFAKLLFKVVRGEDICCRYGGEEFTLLLNEIELDTVVKRATELLQATRGLVLEQNGKLLGNISISLGIAMYPQHGSTQKELIKEADKALYNAKNSGRDQLMVADGDDAEGKLLVQA